MLIIIERFPFNNNCDLFLEALNRISSIFVENGYDANLISTIEKTVVIKDDASKKASDKPTKFVTWTLPYIEENYSAFSDKIRKINRILPDNVKIRPVYNINRTRNYFYNKDKVSPHLKSNCVYSFNCGQCEKVYYGETSRHLASRMNEHLKGYPVPSEISMHVHQASNSDFAVVATTKNRKFLESLLLKHGRNLLNARESSIPLILNL